MLFGLYTNKSFGSASNHRLAHEKKEKKKKERSFPEKPAEFLLCKILLPEEKNKQKQNNGRIGGKQLKQIWVCV